MNVTSAGKSPIGKTDSSLLHQRGTRKAILAGTLGHAIEWFDFGVYAYVAVILAKNFFPSDDPTASLFASLATFGFGFVARPVGGYVFGRMGDTQGRRAVLLVTLLLMGVATLGIAALPTYEAIGLAAPALLVIFRLLQGFSAGGEATTATTFLVEWAPAGKRGLYGSFVALGGGVGLLAGSLLVAITTSAIGTEAMTEWGWRVPFIVGGIITPIAFLIRRSSEESPLFKGTISSSENLRESAEESSSLSATTPHDSVLRDMLRTFVLNGFWAIIFYFFLAYMPTYLQREFDVSGDRAIWINSIATALYLSVVPVAAILSDRFGRKPVLLIACIGFVVAPIPLFAYLHTGTASFEIVLAVVMFIGLLLGIFSGPALTTLSEFFPTAARRNSGLAIGYTLSTVVFGGFTPFIATWLIEVTGNSLAPVFYVTAGAVGGALFVARQRETAKDHIK